MNNEASYHALIVPKAEILKVAVSHVYWPQETVWRLKKGVQVPKQTFAHESTFDGKFSVVGYVLEQCEALIAGAGLKHIKVMTAEGLQPLLATNPYWRIKVPARHVIYAQAHELNTQDNPYKPKSFLRDEIVVSSEWYLDGKAFRVRHSNQDITTARELISGHLFLLKTLNLSKANFS